MTALLEAHEVRKHYGGVAAVDATSLAVEAGSITSLIGPNGAGKTTLFNIVTGFVRPDGGGVTLAERIDGRPPHAVARRGLVRTFQTPRALTRMTVLENVLVGAPAHPRRARLATRCDPAGRPQAGAELRERALELLRLVRLDGAADDYAGTLSGGQRAPRAHEGAHDGATAAAPGRADGRGEPDPRRAGSSTAFARSATRTASPSCSSTTTSTWSRPSATG